MGVHVSKYGNCRLDNREQYFEKLIISFIVNRYVMNQHLYINACLAH